jgi:outer membrane receptor protein involved in Fe transport
MPRPYLRSGDLLLFSVLCLGLSASLIAQSAPEGSLDDESIVTLSPFVVEGTEDDGYFAKSTLAGTRIRTELRDVGAAISVVTPKFLQDTNSKSSADLLVYTTGTEVAGQGGNFAGGGDGPVISSAFDSPVAGTRVRGLAAADNLRDFFLTDIPWDSYNTGRVDLQRGPNSILFGIGSPAGIINNSINGAAFRNANEVEVQVASYGSYRGSLDLNRVLLKDQLAIRVSALYDETKYRQKPAHRSDHRLFGALRFDPEIFNRSHAHTSFRANFEKGEIDGANPRNTPLNDNLTPWFDGMGKATYAWQNIQDRISPAAQPQNPWLGTAAGVFEGMVASFPDPTNGQQGVFFSGDSINYPSTTDPTRTDTNNGRYLGIVSYDQYAKNVKLPGSTLSPHKPKSLTDASIFDFYNNLIDGPNKRNWSEFNAYNLNLSQTFLNNRLGFELAYDNQETKWGYRNFLRDGRGAITVDIMQSLMDGTPNPNVGRAMVIGSGSATSGQTERIRESLRGTAFGELNFKDILAAQSALARVLGKHHFTFSQAKQSAETENSTWNNYFVGEGFLPTASSSLGTAGRDISTFSYLSGNLSGAASASGLNLSRIHALQVPTNSTATNWNTASKTYVSYPVPVINANDGTFTDATRPYTDAYKHKDVIDSTTLVWQGYFFDGNLVPTIGWRRDVANAYDAGPPSKVLGIVSNFADPEWRLPNNQAEAINGRRFSTVTGQTRSLSLVAHVPRSLMRRLPGQMGFSVFYNRSENFQPDASRIDVVGDPVPSPSGETKDYGIAITALDEKFVLKINRYETSVADTTLSTEMGGGWAVGFVEAWGQQFAKNPGNQVWGITSAGSKYGAGRQVWWQPADAGNHVIPGDNNSPYTQAALDAQYDIQQAAIDDWLAPENQISAKMQAAWGMSDFARGGGSISNPLVRLTGDTVSKGTEFELIARPIKNWEISVNASKTDARRTSIAKSFESWIAKRTEDFAGPMGDIRFWGSGNWVLAEGSNSTVRDFWKYTLLSGYSLAQALNDSSVPELRPWRFNGTTAYSFNEGRLKGIAIGGSYRWQDRQVTGFPLNSTLNGYDVSRPYFGPSEDAVDGWVSYSRQLSRRINWRIQLNVRDAFANKDLIPITVQPDGTPAAYRIPPPRVITLVNSFEF